MPRATKHKPQCVWQQAPARFYRQDSDMGRTCGLAEEEQNEGLPHGEWRPELASYNGVSQDMLAYELSVGRVREQSFRRKLKES